MSDSVIIALIGAVVSLGSLAMTLLIKRSQNKLHKQINSRMDELLALTRKEGKAEGNKEGRIEAENEK